MITDRVSIVGVLNVTPDSYHDGGKFTSAESALVRAKEMIDEGADIIEIGGESSGPGSEEISADEELTRILPVLQAIRSSFPDVNVSVDTWKSAVAEAALREGVIMINDVTAGRGDPKMFSVANDSAAFIILMYAKDLSARTTVREDQYDDVVQMVKNFLQERKEAAITAGIPSARIILDPGLGHFISSDPKYSFEILARLPEILELECPIFISPSRKSFLAGSEQLKTADRLPGTIAASAIAVLNGATYIRTHDVREVRRGCAVAQSIKQNMKK